jgi:hypothetical protein
MMSSTATVRSSSLSFLPLMTLASQKSKKRNFLVLQLYCQFIARVSIRSFFFPYLQASRALLEYFPSYVRTKYIASGLLAIFEYGTFVGRRARGGRRKLLSVVTWKFQLDFHPISKWKLYSFVSEQQRKEDARADKS